jgi:integrase
MASRAAAGIEDLHVRGLRATCATRLQEGGATEFDVKLALGHSVGSMGVTGRYIDPHEDHRRRIAELTVRRKSDKVVPLRERNLAKNGTDLVREANVQIGDLVTS